MKKYAVAAMIGLCVIFIQAVPPQVEPETKAELGKMLFFDPILSRNRTISCAGCHLPQYAFADTVAVSAGVDNRKGFRNTPTVMNVLLQKTFFWDGRAKTLEEQALGPIENPQEMDLPLATAVNRLENNISYKKYFQKIFGSGPGTQTLAEALAAFERTLETSDSPFDNWKFSDDSAAVSSQVKKGFELFNGKAKCVKCHFGADFTANEFRNIGLFDGKKLNDSGRSVISGDKTDIGKFKTASLRNVAVTAPYMHNGMFGSLSEVIDFYNDPAAKVPGAINRDSLLNTPLGLTQIEKKAIESFLVSLTDNKFVIHKSKD